ncbi:MAG: YtxH domain-containing protein [Thermodesulfovibrionales bacterium]|nr:YtxH domain-containing protein [Thermodesulfovibrionales bacterium]
MRHEGRYSNIDLFLSFLLGGVIGVGLALLLAPQSGLETRKKIKEFTGETKEKAKKYAEGIKGKVTSTVEKGKELFGEKKSSLSAAIEAGKEAYKKETERLTEEEGA